ncbi:hypothetical protein GE061_005375 [Apolygus lucorum]|uniref:Uncharacterized protein n=1 Tax=Apolygus lucorum TaxID=248454 RepID=A0A8S9WXU6_APOLU|nr:hypothetical protein GE061_005375 [Apolygus lucorum]
MMLPTVASKTRRHVQYDLPFDNRADKFYLPPIDQKRIEIQVPIVVRKPKSLTVKPECNYIPEMDSLPSITSIIPDHWRDEQARVVRERPSDSEVQQQKASSPRTFFPLGVDWDSRLEATNYGTDVVLKSSSSSLLLVDPDERASPQDFISVADWFVHTKGTRLAQETTLSMIVSSDESYDDDDDKKKKVVMSRDRHVSSSMTTARQKRPYSPGIASSAEEAKERT